jgi:hypothetical protein
MRKKTMMLLAVLGLGLASLYALTSIATAQGSTDGTITISSRSVAVGVGVTWGDGVLTYRGKKYPVSVSGLSVVDLGVSKISARGEVHNLKKLEDFDGNYAAAGAGATVGGGAGAAALKNQNGVEVTLTATTKGVKFALAGGGVEMKVKK